MAGNLYSTDDHNIAAEVREWAIANGDNPKARIALCGYDNEHDDVMPPSWSRYRWNAHGGYAHTGNGRGKDNARREVIWFSPHCLATDTGDALPLFQEVKP